MGSQTPYFLICFFSHLLGSKFYVQWIQCLVSKSRLKDCIANPCEQPWHDLPRCFLSSTCSPLLAYLRSSLRSNLRSLVPSSSLQPQLTLGITMQCNCHCNAGRSSMLFSPLQPFSIGLLYIMKELFQHISTSCSSSLQRWFFNLWWFLYWQWFCILAFCPLYRMSFKFNHLGSHFTCVPTLQNVLHGLTTWQLCPMWAPHPSMRLVTPHLSTNFTAPVPVHTFVQCSVLLVSPTLVLLWV